MIPLAVVPSVLYTINNNLGQVAVNYVDAVSWQALTQNRILATVMLWRLAFPEKVIEFHQYLALLLLTVSSAFIAYENQSEQPSAGAMYVTPVGVAAVLLFCLNSGAAGVYIEYIY